MCLTFISVIEITYLKKEKVIQVSQEKLFGIKLEQELHRMEAALHACLHLGSSTAISELWAPRDLAPAPSAWLGTQRWQQPPVPTRWGCWGASQQRWQWWQQLQVNKQTNLPTQKETWLWVQYFCSSPQCSLLGQLWAAMTSWPCTTAWECRGLPTGWEWHPAEVGT